MVDLHTHTNRSDGSFTPTELVAHAKELGLKAVAITDHDTFNGLEEGLEAGKKYGIEVIPGVELSTKIDGHNVHITGLFIDINNKEINEFLKFMKDTREGRNLVMIRKLEELGLNISLSDFPPIEDDVVITKGNIASVLVERGYAKDSNEAIEKYLEKGGLAYVPRKHPSPQKGIDIIHAAGGKAFLAHFNQIVKKDRDESERYARMIMEMGADGIETRYSEFDDDLRERAEKIASDYQVLRSGGSDFHGTIKPKIALGTGFGDLVVPDEFLVDIKASL